MVNRPDLGDEIMPSGILLIKEAKACLFVNKIPRLFNLEKNNYHSSPA